MEFKINFYAIVNSTDYVDDPGAELQDCYVACEDHKKEQIKRLSGLHNENYHAVILQEPEDCDICLGG